MNKWLYTVGALMIAGFVALGASEMKRAQAPYVHTVKELEASKGGPVQFMGAVVPGKTRYGGDFGELVFVMRDDHGQTLEVHYKGVKPQGFDSAPKAVVRGTYADGRLAADQVLLKCPSKYDGK